MLIQRAHQTLCKPCMFVGCDYSTGSRAVRDAKKLQILHMKYCKKCTDEEVRKQVIAELEGKKPVAPKKDTMVLNKTKGMFEVPKNIFSERPTDES